MIAQSPQAADRVWSLAVASLLFYGRFAAELDADDDGRDWRVAALLRAALPELRRVVAPGLPEGPQSRRC